MHPASWLANRKLTFSFWKSKSAFPDSQGDLIARCSYRGGRRIFGNLHTLPNGYKQAHMYLCSSVISRDDVMKLAPIGTPIDS
jgi:hypothetical protein